MRQPVDNQRTADSTGRATAILRHSRPISPTRQRTIRRDRAPQTDRETHAHALSMAQGATGGRADPRAFRIGPQRGTSVGPWPMAASYHVGRQQPIDARRANAPRDNVAVPSVGSDLTTAQHGAAHAANQGHVETDRSGRSHGTETADSPHARSSRRILGTMVEPEPSVWRPTGADTPQDGPGVDRTGADQSLAHGNATAGRL